MNTMKPEVIAVEVAALRADAEAQADALSNAAQMAVRPMLAKLSAEELGHIGGGGPIFQW